SRAARAAPLLLAALAARLAAQEPASGAPPRDAAATAPLPAAGPWRAWLDSPGGELPFGLTLSRDSANAGAAWHAEIEDGFEHSVVPLVTGEPGRLVLEIDNYAARVEAMCTDARTLAGTWTCDKGPGRLSKLAFHAVAGEAPRFPALERDELEDDDVAGR